MSSNMSGGKVGTRRVNCEDVASKRRKLDARCFRSLFCKTSDKSVSTEPGEVLSSLGLSNCVATETEVEENHHSATKQSDDNLRQEACEIVQDPDLHHGRPPEIQSRDVSNVIKEKPWDQNVDHELYASKCKANPVELDLLTKNKSKFQPKDVLHALEKDGPRECDTKVQENSYFPASHDNRDLATHVKGDTVEGSDENCVKSKTKDATAKESSLHVNDEEITISNKKDVDHINHIAAARDWAQACHSDSSSISYNMREATDLSGRSASSPSSYRFAEYWVPARLSYLQLEQYCAALLANSITLSSNLKSDPVGALRNLLITLRKICNHPFLVDPDLSASLLKDRKATEYLDVGVKASGKLQLLEKMLLEMRERGLRVLIVYESSIYARDTIGEILDDFLLQRFGQDSFEHVNGGGSIPSKKQAALKRFNDKECGRFVFLMETRACVSSIKLSSVDSIIIFNSDWNPVNDRRALRKIVLDSQHNLINIFRLFLPLTVEENDMILSKHGVTVDNNMHTISQSQRDQLLIRGASDLFDELESFHVAADSLSSMISSFESSLLQDVVEELMAILTKNHRQMDNGVPIYLKVQNSCGGQGKFRLVPDELKNLLTEERWPRDFWSKLLKARNPRWKYVSDFNKRKRKIVDYNEGDDVENHRKVIHDSIGVASANENRKEGKAVKGSGCTKHLSPVIAEVVLTPLELHSNHFGASNASHCTKKSLHLLPKPGLQKLCELLNLSEDIKIMAEWFLEYVTENHYVTREPVTLLQAFQMSVCWIAASLQKQKVNYQEHLALAKNHLNFCCSADDTDYMYLKMVLLKELFIQSFVGDKAKNYECNSIFLESYISKDSVVRLSPVTSESKSLTVLDTEKLLVKTIKHIKQKGRERMKNLIQNQRKETEELQKSSNEEKRQLEKEYKMEAAVVRTIHAKNPALAAEKLEALEERHSKRLEEHREKLNTRFKSLEDKHSSEKDKENELTSSWKKDIVKEQIELLSELTRKDLEDGKQKCDSKEQLTVLDSRTECHTLEGRKVVSGRPGMLAERVEDCGSANHDDSLPLPLPPASSEAGNNAVAVDSVVSTSTKVLPDDSASISSDIGQVACGQAAKIVDLTSYMEVPKSSSFDALPMKLGTSALTDGASPEEKLDCPAASQQLSPSAYLIPAGGLSNPLTLDAHPALSSDKAICDSQCLYSEVPTMGHSASLHLSPAALDTEDDNSSPVPSSKTDNGLSPSQLNVGALASRGKHDIPFSTMTSGFEQSDIHIQLGQSVLFTTVDHSNVDPTANAVHQLPASETQHDLQSSTVSAGFKQSQQSKSDIQPSHVTTDFSNAECLASLQPSATEGQPQFPSKSITPESEKSLSDTQLELLGRAASDHIDSAPTSAEPEYQLLATERQPDSAFTLGCEEYHSDGQLDESLLRCLNQSFVQPPTSTSGQHEPELSSSFVIAGSEQSHPDVSLDQSLLRTTTGQPDPSAGESAHLLLATEGETELSSSVITPGLGKSPSDVLFDPILLPTATDCSNIDPLAAEEIPQLSTIDELRELPPTALRSKQPDSDSQLGQSLRHPATDNSNVEPSAGEALHQLPLSPFDDSSSSHHHLSRHLSEELPSRGIDITLNADALNPSPPPSVVSVLCVSPTSNALSHSPSMSELRTTNAISDFPASLIPGPALAFTVPPCMSMLSQMDPLQIELERIQKEEDCSSKKYEEMKQLFSSECEKEIEETVTQIRKKYEIKNMEFDAEMKYKKSELAAYRSKVCMNRMLAEIFRNKCMVPKRSLPPGMPQDHVQNQLRSHRHPLEAGVRPSIIANTSPAVHASGNLHGAYESMPPTHPSVHGANSTAPTARNMMGTQDQLDPSGTLAASSQNDVRTGGLPSAPYQNCLSPGASASPYSYSAPPVSGSTQASHIPVRSGVTTKNSPATPLPRSTTPASSGLPSSGPYQTPISRAVGIQPTVHQSMSGPVQVVNCPAALFSGNVPKPVSTTVTSTIPPTVNLRIISGTRAPPHLRSRASQPMATHTSVAPHLRNSSQLFSNVSLTAPLAISQHRYTSNHGTSELQSANSAAISNRQDL